MIIRRFSDDDANEVSAVIIEALKVSNSKDYPKDYIDNYVNKLTPQEVIQRASDAHFYVVCDKDRIIACAGIGSYWGSLTESWLTTVFVHPDYQGRGVGRKLIETLEKDEYFLRADRIEVPASITGTPFYIKMGYNYKQGVNRPDDEGLIRLEKFREI